MQASVVAGYSTARAKFQLVGDTVVWLVFSYLAWALVLRPTIVWVRKWNALRPLPGPCNGLPFWYSIRTYWEKSRSNSVKDATYVFFQIICDVSQQYRGTTFKAYLGMTPVVILHTPDAAQTLLTSKTNLRKPVVYNFLASWLGHHNILTAVGDSWRFKRRLMTPAFHFKVLEDYISSFNYNGKLLVERVDRLTAKHPGEPIPAFRLSQNCALDVTTKVLMGVDLDSQLDTTEPTFANHFNMLMFLIGVRIFRPWMWPDAWYNRTHEGRLYHKSIREMEKYTLEVLERRKGKLQQIADELESVPGDYGREGDDEAQDSVIVDRFLKAHLQDSRYSIDEVKKDIDSLLFAGTDTTTSAVGWAFYMLGLHPKVLAKVHQELDDIFGSDTERDITGEDLKRMKYLDICFKESLRLFPAAPLIGRVLDEDLVVDGYKIPKGVTCFVNIYSLHRNPECFKDPDLYIPERFLTSEVGNRHPFSYIPFSGGPKNCLGQRFAILEAKTLLAKVLLKYTLESTRPVSELRITYEVILKARGGLRIWFRNRTHADRAAKLAGFEETETNYGL
ncbi:cytochrome P450 4V2-like isoform X2 [Dermacentor variabilis]|uniref:cytochrome P450 4V2-like isoform X2 n=1 Tax=Dermacentor variabilis TaxID=34621 RepID=UPI003F5C307C